MACGSQTRKVAGSGAACGERKVEEPSLARMGLPSVQLATAAGAEITCSRKLFLPAGTIARETGARHDLERKTLNWSQSHSRGSEMYGRPRQKSAASLM